MIKTHKWRRSENQTNNFTMSNKIPAAITLNRGDGKSCAIVGNAQSILNKTDGYMIDAHDVVVRINTPKILNERCQGKRCDILFVTPVSASQLSQAEIKNTPQIINISAQIADYFNMWTDKLRQDVNCLRARPTTGFVAVAKMIELGYSVSMFGFDWFETPSLSGIKNSRVNIPAAKTLWKYHYPQWEKQQVEQILFQGIIKQPIGDIN